MSEHHQIVSELTTRDKIEVVLYRFGIFSFACVLLISGLEALQIISVLQEYMIPVTGVITLHTAVFLHTYIKPVRNIVRLAPVVGLISLIFTANTQFDILSLGCFYFAMSGIALKEYICFKVTGTTLSPLVLIAAIIGYWFENMSLGGNAQIFAAALFLILAVSKATQKLSDDIGDKSLYQ